MKKNLILIVLNYERADALNGYETFLQPPQCVPDVAYQINKELMNRNLNYACINTSVEASTLKNHLDKTQIVKHQDDFIRNNITKNDYLIVSVGGNDVILDPNEETQRALGALPKDLSKPEELDNWLHTWKGHFINIFKIQVETYVSSLITEHKPKKIIICLPYFPDKTPGTDTWARRVTDMGYDDHPEVLQKVMKEIFQMATQKINILDDNIVAFPLYEVLNGEHTQDYVSRVEPSAIGGEKMAKAFVTKLFV